MKLCALRTPIVVLLVGAVLGLGSVACSSDGDGADSSDGDGTGTLSPVATEVVADGPGVDAAAAFIGLPREDAANLAQSEGRSWRVGAEDGEPQALNDDLLPGRVTFELEQGVVTGATIEQAIDGTADPGDRADDDFGPAELVAAAVNQILTVDHSFGTGAPPPFDDVRVADAIGGNGGSPLPSLHLELIADVVQQTGATVEFTSDPRAMIDELFDANQPGVAVVTVGALRLEDGRAEVEMELWCGSLCGVYLTYEVVQQTDGNWQVTGPIGPIAIS